MDMKDSRVINAPQEKVWVALNDPAMLKQCIIGCDSLEATEPGTFEALLSVSIGPVKAKFKGKLRLSDLQPPNSYQLAFEGSGGAAGHGKGTAQVRLESTGPAMTTLHYEANASVGGKIAQIGSRLVDAAARKIADDFFSKFDALVAEPVAEVAAASAPDTSAPVVAVSKSSVPVWVWIVAAVVIAAGLYKWFL